MVGLALGPKYAQISSHSLGKIAMVVFVRLKLQQHIGEVQTSSVATGNQCSTKLLVQNCCGVILHERMISIITCSVLSYWPGLLTLTKNIIKVVTWIKLVVRQAS